MNRSRLLSAPNRRKLELSLFTFKQLYYYWKTFHGMPEAVQGAIKVERDTVSDFEKRINEVKLEEIDETGSFLEVKSESKPNIGNITSKSYVQDFSPKHCHHHTSELVVQDILKEERESGEPKKVLQLYIDLKEARRLVQRQRRRERIALQLAQETPEQRDLRREKVRSAKAALRAAEPLEKILIRREKDRKAKAAVRAAESLEESMLRRERERKAKAMSRMRETEEQRRIRLEKNRIAMATLRAALSEEEKFRRREKDRINKARMRAFETDEQRRVRREKNRIAVAIKRGNSSMQKRNCKRKADCVTKDSLKISL